jgi:hypothetical protein
MTSGIAVTALVHARTFACFPNAIAVIVMTVFLEDQVVLNHLATAAGSIMQQPCAQH